LALVPLLWTAGALIGMFADPASRWRQLNRGLIAVSGTLSAAIIVWSPDPDKIAEIALLMSASLLLTLLHIIILERKLLGGWPWRSFGLLLVLPSVASVLFWPTPYQITTPGFTLNMNRYAMVEGGHPKGSIEGVLVIERPAFPIDWLYAAIFPHLQIEKRDTSISIGEIRNEVIIERAGANEIGSAVAFHKLGIGRGVIPTGVQVLQVAAGSPAQGRLNPGDLIIALNGKAISSTTGLAAAMSGVRPGESVAVTVQRGGRRIDISLKTSADKDNGKRAVFGITVENGVKVDLPREVDFRSYLVYQGGPSHGAILALTLIDQLTPGGVTYGNRVAGTGTIDAEGNVGAIGGIEQKAYAVERSGADVFFVPAGQEADARKGAPSLNIVPVHTLDDMLNWLKKHPKT
jgi:PDZ domain-containing protein